MTSRPALIDQKNLWKTFFIFVIPLIATNFLQSLSGTLNTVFVGQLMGVQAVAAVSVFFPIFFFLMSFIIGLSAGTTVLVGQAWGAQDHDKVRRIVGSTFFMALLGGGTIACFGVWFTPEILNLLGTDPSIRHLSQPYVQWMLGGSPLIFFYVIYTSVLRGVGDSTTPLIALGLTSMIGIMLTFILLKGYLGIRLGIIAPAIATILSNIIVLMFLSFYLKHSDQPLKLNWTLIRHIRCYPELISKILKLGIPTSIQMVTTALAGLVLVSLINQYGAHATAAYGAVNQVTNYIQFPAISISIAASIFAAQAIGAGKAELLSRVTRVAMSINFLFTGSLIILAYLFSKYLVAMFITDPSVIKLTQQLLFIVLWSIIFFGASAIFASIMRASGTVNIPMLINIFAIVGIEVPAAYYFNSIWGLKGIWMGYALAFVSLCLMQGAYYQWVWKKTKIIQLV